MDKFTELRQEIPFMTWPPDDPKRDDGVLEIQFQFDSLAEWERHKEKLATVTRLVYEALPEGEDE